MDNVRVIPNRYWLTLAAKDYLVIRNGDAILDWSIDTWNINVGMALALVKVRGVDINECGYNQDLI